MSKREIKGLQDLALAHGGSLTINPETGLVEAGFLEQILPVVAAAGLTYLTAGAAAPLMAGALGTTGAGIVAGAGAGALISGGFAAAQGKDVGNAALMGGLGGAISGGLGAYDAAPNLLNAGASAPVPTEGLTNIASNTAITPDMASSLTSADTTQLNQLVAQNSSMVPQNVPPSQMTSGQFADFGSSRFGAPVGASDLTTGMGAPSAATLQNASGAAKTLNAPSSYYAGLQPDQYVQKAAIQGLPALGLLEDKPQQMGPEEEESTLNRLSPNFQAYVPPQPNPYYRAQYPTYAAEGGIMSSYQSGGPVERMSQMNTALNPQGGMYPQGMIDKTQYAIPTQRPTSMEVVDAGAQRTFNTGGIAQQRYLPKGDAGRFVDSDPNTRSLSAFDAAQHRLKKLGARSGIKMAEMPKTGIKSLGGDFSDMAARGGVAHLGDYSDGGRLLRGPGDGVSDNIPATIGGKQPARLADGEFVVPARIVSELGNGSTDAGAKRLYAMMDRVQKARKKTIGKGKIAKDSKSSKYLPA
jgi:hypothetical protein